MIRPLTLISVFNIVYFSLNILGEEQNVEVIKEGEIRETQLQHVRAVLEQQVIKADTEAAAKITDAEGKLRDAKTFVFNFFNFISNILRISTNCLRDFLILASKHLHVCRDDAKSCSSKVTCERMRVLSESSRSLSAMARCAPQRALSSVSASVFR